MIRLDAVSKRYPNGHLAVRELTLDVDEGEVAVLVGPSGCGKTTILRMINRLIEPTGGRIFLEGEDVTHAAPVKLRRRIGYVIQQIGLFPHQTIEQNVGTVPRLLGWPKARIRDRSDELLELVGLDPEEYRGRYPHQLSGGQRQRVGVARALAADPPVLLMDEPFGAIDPITRGRLQDEFIRLQAELCKTVVFVTHDIEEAVKLGTRIAILNIGGELEQYAAPADVLGEPATPFVAAFVGSDRALKRLKVTPIEPGCFAEIPVVTTETTLAAARDQIAKTALDAVPVVDAAGAFAGRLALVDTEGDGAVASRVGNSLVTVDLGDSLEHALAQTLLTDDGWVAVLDQGRYAGVLTPQSIHRSLRASLMDDVRSSE